MDTEHIKIYEHIKKKYDLDDYIYQITNLYNSYISANGKPEMFFIFLEYCLNKLEIELEKK